MLKKTGYQILILVSLLGSVYAHAGAPSQIIKDLYVGKWTPTTPNRFDPHGEAGKRSILPSHDIQPIFPPNSSYTRAEVQLAQLRGKEGSFKINTSEGEILQGDIPPLGTSANPVDGLDMRATPDGKNVIIDATLSREQENIFVKNQMTRIDGRQAFAQDSFRIDNGKLEGVIKSANHRRSIDIQISDDWSRTRRTGRLTPDGMEPNAIILHSHLNAETNQIIIHTSDGRVHTYSISDQMSVEDPTKRTGRLKFAQLSSHLSPQDFAFSTTSIPREETATPVLKVRPTNGAK